MQFRLNDSKGEKTERAIKQSVNGTSTQLNNSLAKPDYFVPIYPLSQRTDPKGAIPKCRHLLRYPRIMQGQKALGNYIVHLSKFSTIFLGDIIVIVKGFYDVIHKCVLQVSVLPPNRLNNQKMEDSSQALNPSQHIRIFSSIY